MLAVTHALRVAADGMVMCVGGHTHCVSYYIPYMVGHGPVGGVSSLTSEGVGQCVVWYGVTDELNY